MIQEILLRHVFRSKSNGILGHNCLSGRSMCSNENRVAVFQVVHSLLLESVELEWPLGKFSLRPNIAEVCVLTSFAILGTSSRKLVISWFTSTMCAHSFVSGFDNAKGRIPFGANIGNYGFG